MSKKIPTKKVNIGVKNDKHDKYKEEQRKKLEAFRERLGKEENDKARIDDRFVSSLLDPYGLDAEQDSGITDINVFVTKFEESDVQYFIEKLSNTSPQLYRYNLENLLTESLKKWCGENPQTCPYEPFLWALKMVDGYVGSLHNGQQPELWRIQAVGNALMNIWNAENALYIDVLKNVIINWDWYQPIQISLYLYQCLKDINDDEIDKCIREHWLYRALYSTTAFHCICGKKKSPENIYALMNFVSQDRQSDKNACDILITKGMRNSLANYILQSSQETYGLAKSFYIDQLSYCSKNARVFFDELFGPEIVGEVEAIIKNWNTPVSEIEANNRKKRLENLYNKNGRNATTIVRGAAKSGYSTLIQEVLAIVKRCDFSFQTQFVIKEMAQSVHLCQDYQNFIVNKYQENATNYTEESFVYCCAYCLSGHPEVMENLFTVHYLQGVGTTTGRYIFDALREVFNEQFDEQIERITSECLQDNEKALDLITSCAKKYSINNSRYYPVNFDKVCDFLLDQISPDNSSSARYASVLMDIYEHIVRIDNRDRYEPALTKIIGAAGFTLSTARERAKKLVRDVYGAI